jgi:glycosyltransferase involved in cell wall biosynthesis
MLYRAYGRVLTHSESQQALARSIAPGVEVAEVRLPLADFLFSSPDVEGGADGAADAGLGTEAARRHGRQDPAALTLGFFGMVRDYKGVDLLLRAMAEVDGVRLVIAGEFWKPVDEYRALIAELGLEGRVEIVDGYVPFADLPGILCRVDMLALPYRSGTATINVFLAAHFGLPTFATRAATMALDISDGVDGILVEPGSADALRDGLRRLLEPGVLERLQAGVDPSRQQRFWDDYVLAVEQLAR